MTVATASLDYIRNLLINSCSCCILDFWCISDLTYAFNHVPHFLKISPPEKNNFHSKDPSKTLYITLIKHNHISPMHYRKSSKLYILSEEFLNPKFITDHFLI